MYFSAGIFVGVCCVLCFFFRTCFPSLILLLAEVPRFFKVVIMSRLLIGDNNLSRFWAAFQFARPNMKSSSLLTATDLDTLDHALSKVDDHEQVIISVLTAILMEEANSSDVPVSASNVCAEVVTRLRGICPRSPTCQVRFIFAFDRILCFVLGLIMGFFSSFSILPGSLVCFC